MNLSDSERIAQILEDSGYKSAPEEEADLVVINACSVRQKAVDRIWGKVKNWKNEKKKIIITGCVLPADKEKFFRKKIEYFEFKDNNFFNIAPDPSASCAYITIMTGCDNFCTYCAVPYTRGREKSRPLKDILAEAQQAIKNGQNEILLLGQNVNSYKYNFGKLIEKIDNLEGNFTFNFISSNPHDLNDEIIKALSGLKKWPRQLHLALQSGDDEILKKMNRKYSSRKFIKKVAKLRKIIPDIQLSTDIIVGFPGETKKQFENTVRLCRKIRITKAYISQYSPRPGTPAAKLKDDVSPIEKKRRWQKLEKLLN